MLARVVVGGELAVGDELTLLEPAATIPAS
jgi:MOSC domain-containing protein YiiM